VTNLSRTILLLAGVCALGLPISLVFADGAFAGPLVIGFFVCLALGGRGHPFLKNFTFTLSIFAAVATSMFYPQHFDEVGDFTLTRLIVPLIQVIMFGMGTALSLRDFVGVVRMPRGVVVGMVCQFTIMPLVGVTLAMAFGFSPEVAAGIVLIGSAPGGVASNVMAYLAGANVALSVTLTTCSTLAAPLMTPLLMELLAGQFVPVDVFAMMLSIINMIILPVLAGLLFNQIFRGRVAWLHRAMPVVSMVAIAVVISIITAAGRDALLQIGLALIGAAIIHNAAGYLLGYWGGRLARLDEQSCRTIAIEVGMQNGGMASGIALEMGKVATVGLAPAIFGPWMNISGSILANYWRGKPLPGAEPPAIVDGAETEPVAT
jgi:BASS family bile acid:Na+ symporter